MAWASATRRLHADLGELRGVRIGRERRDAPARATSERFQLVDREHEPPVRAGRQKTRTGCLGGETERGQPTRAVVESEGVDALARLSGIGPNVDDALAVDGACLGAPVRHHGADQTDECGDGDELCLRHAQ